jgi:excisionase family DNA binding protein
MRTKEQTIEMIRSGNLEHFSTSQICALLCTSQSTIRRYIVSGMLAAKKISGSYKIARKDLIRFLKS